MKFIDLKLKNFRQYIGDNHIHFCHSNDKNVTLVFGANGFGKTGIFRAIMFALYGDKSLKQDGLTESQKLKGLTLVNEKLLEENEGAKVTAEVILEFEDNDKGYILKRSVIGQKNDDKIDQEPGNVSLIVRENSNTKPPITDHEEIENIISTIIDKKIRDFFLFDGEQIEELTKYSKDSRNEVKKGIKNLLQLDAIEIAQTALKKNIQALNKDIENNSSGELEIISERISQADSKIQKMEDELNTLKENIQYSYDEEKEVEEKISENKEAIEKQKERENIKVQIKQLEEGIIELEQKLKEMLETSGAFVSLPVLTELYLELDSKMQKGELPSGLRQEFIDKLLSECRCICGTNLNEDTTAKEFLLNYKEKNSTIPDAAINVFKLVNHIKTQVEFSQKDTESILSRYNKFKEELDNLNKKLEDLDEELTGIKPVQDLATRLTKIKADRRDYINRQGRLENELEKIKAARDIDESKQKRLAEQNEKANRLITQREIVSKASNELDKIYTEYSDELRINLSRCATEILHQIADSSTLKSLSEITISDDFQLEVLSSSGSKMLKEISKGQRQLVSLSYICALLKVGSNLEMPLLMDTPFGRLSADNRDACLVELPKILPQWILLATDTEIQEPEAEALRKSGKWGAVYEISHFADRQSRIENKDINHWQPHRKSQIKELV